MPVGRSSIAVASLRESGRSTTCSSSGRESKRRAGTGNPIHRVRPNPNGASGNRTPQYRRRSHGFLLHRREFRRTGSRARSPESRLSSARSSDGACTSACDDSAARSVRPSGFRECPPSGKRVSSSAGIRGAPGDRTTLAVRCRSACRCRCNRAARLQRGAGPSRLSLCRPTDRRCASSAQFSGANFAAAKCAAKPNLPHERMVTH